MEKGFMKEKCKQEGKMKGKYQKKGVYQSGVSIRGVS